MAGFDCGNCIHGEVCDCSSKRLWGRLMEEDDCADFIDKSRIVELPIKATDELRAELTEYCHSRCVEEL